jgi:hypothetical protein
MAERIKNVVDALIFVKKQNIVRKIVIIHEISRVSGKAEKCRAKFETKE